MHRLQGKTLLYRDVFEFSFLEENQEKAERLVDEIGKLEEQIGQLKRELENTRKIINGVQRAFEAFTNPKDEN